MNNTNNTDLFGITEELQKTLERLLTLEETLKVLEEYTLSAYTDNITEVTINIGSKSVHFLTNTNNAIQLLKSEIEVETKLRDKLINQIV